MSARRIFLKAIRHVFGFGIEFLKNKDIGIFGHFIVIDFIKKYSYHTYFSPILTSRFRRFGTGCIVRNGERRIFANYSVFSALFSLKLSILFEEGILGTLVQKDAVPPIYSYRITIDEHPISLRQICVLGYLCLLLTKVLFETSLKSFQHNTEGRRLSNYSIKLISCSHFCSRCKGLCQNKKHEFDQYTKGGHFCAAHMALTQLICLHISHNEHWKYCKFFRLSIQFQWDKRKMMWRDIVTHIKKVNSICTCISRLSCSLS